jgi:hypothetical protein
VNNWPVVLLAATAALLFRRQGDSWPVTMAKMAGLAVVYLTVVTIAGIAIAWLS